MDGSVPFSASPSIGGYSDIMSSYVTLEEAKDDEEGEGPIAWDLKNAKNHNKGCDHLLNHNDNDCVHNIEFVTNVSQQRALFEVEKDVRISYDRLCFFG